MTDSPNTLGAIAEAAPRRRSPRILGKLLFSLCVGLITAEAGTRLIDWKAGRDASNYLPAEFDHGQSMYEPHPYIGFQLKKNYTSPRGHLHTNSLRMRGPEIPESKPGSVYRIFCLGGSTTFGTGASDDSHTYPAELDRKLNAIGRRGLRYEVSNCGVSGYNSIENLIQLELRLVELKPDAILYYEAANDAFVIQARGFLPDYSHVRCTWVQTAISPFEQFLLRTSRLYAWISRGRQPEAAVGALSDYTMVSNYKKVHDESPSEVNDEGVKIYIRNLRYMIEAARKHQILPVLSTFAVCFSKRTMPTDENYKGVVAAMNRSLRELAAQEKVPLLDIAPELDEKPPLFADWMHFNDAGEAAHAAAVVKCAKELGLFYLGK